MDDDSSYDNREPLPRATAIAMLLLAGLALAALACASAGSTTTAQLTVVEARWVKALRAHDTVALDRLLDDRFVDSTFRGTVRSKRDVLAGPPAGGPYHSIRLDDLVVRSYGHSTAIVTGVNVLQGKDAGDIVRVRFTDVFIRQRGEWRAVAAQETLQAAP
ncbi:MAG: nuclear transport factor 2 family protein [Acidobacteriota bacterium]